MYRAVCRVYVTLHPHSGEPCGWGWHSLQQAKGQSYTSLQYRLRINSDAAVQPGVAARRTLRLGLVEHVGAEGVRGRGQRRHNVHALGALLPVLQERLRVHAPDGPPRVPCSQHT